MDSIKIRNSLYEYGLSILPRRCILRKIHFESHFETHLGFYLEILASCTLHCWTPLLFFLLNPADSLLLLLSSQLQPPTVDKLAISVQKICNSQLEVFCNLRTRDGNLHEGYKVPGQQQQQQRNGQIKKEIANPIAPASPSYMNLFDIFPFSPESRTLLSSAD